MMNRMKYYLYFLAFFLFFCSFFFFYNSVGEPFSNQKEIDEVSTLSSYPKIAIDSKNTIYVVYSDEIENSEE